MSSATRVSSSNLHRDFYGESNVLSPFGRASEKRYIQAYEWMESVCRKQKIGTQWASGSSKDATNAPRMG